MTRKEIIVLLDNIRSRENVGSIFRTADAAGVGKIYLCGITPTPNQYQVSSIKHQGETDKIAKTALGAEMWVSWEYRAKTWQVLRELKVRSEKFKVVGLEQTKNSKNIFKFKSKFPIVLVVGNEVRGLSPEILKYCDDVIAIPMFGKKESLNVSVATGVALYQIKSSQ